MFCRATPAIASPSAFAQTRAERLAAGDPRLSVEERYGSQEGYNCVVRNAAARLVKDRLLLAEDADRLIAQAAGSNVLPSDPNNPVASFGNRQCVVIAQSIALRVNLQSVWLEPEQTMSGANPEIALAIFQKTTDIHIRNFLRM